MQRACPSEESLVLLAAGAIEDAELSNHVAACPACGARARHLAEEERFLADFARAAREDEALNTESSGEGEYAHESVAPAGYELLAELSRGGQGIVYTAREQSSGRIVAIKMLLGGTLASSRARARFEREIEIAASLTHPAIVRVYTALRTRQGDMAIVMEHVEGEALDVWATRQRAALSPADWTRSACRVIAQAAAGVGYAHRRGFIHRDLKPANIIIDATDQARVLDFGIARRTDGSGDVTMTGEFVGTLAYVAPEQVRGDGREVDVRTDVYALGLVLYELLAGRCAYDVGTSLSEAVATITQIEPRALRSRGRGAVSADVETIVFKALAKDPSRRYRAADDFAEDLEAALAGGPIAARRDSTLYVLRTRLKRRWRAVSSVGAAIASGLVLLGVVVAGETREAAIERARKAEAERAEAQAVRSRAVAFVMASIVPEPRRFDLGEADPHAHAVATELRRIEGMLEQGSFAHDPAYEQALRTALAQLYAESVALSGMGEIAARHVLSGTLRLHGPEHVAVAEAHHELARVILARKRPAEAEREAAKAADMRARLLAWNDVRTIESRVLVARAQVEQGKAGEALDAMMDIEQKPGDLPPALAIEVASTRALALAAFERTSEAQSTARSALVRAARELMFEESAFVLALRTAGRVGLSQGLDMNLMALADSIAAGQPDAKSRAATIDAVVALRERLVGEVHAAVGFDLAILAWITMWDRQPNRAHDAMTRAVPILEEALGPQHRSLATVYHRFELTSLMVGDFSASAEYARRCIDIWLAQPVEVQDRVSIAVQHRAVSQYLLYAARFDEAEAAAHQAIEQLSTALAPDHYAVGMARCGLAWALAETGRVDEAESMARAALALMLASPATPIDQMLVAKGMAGIVLQRAGHPDEAAVLLLGAISTLIDVHGTWDPRNASFVDALEAASIELGHPVPEVVATYRATSLADLP